jgi:hypothetical protein
LHELHARYYTSIFIRRLLSLLPLDVAALLPPSRAWHPAHTNTSHHITPCMPNHITSLKQDNDHITPFMEGMFAFASPFTIFRRHNITFPRRGLFLAGLGRPSTAQHSYTP